MDYSGQGNVGNREMPMISTMASNAMTANKEKGKEAIESSDSICSQFQDLALCSRDSNTAHPVSTLSTTQNQPLTEFHLFSKLPADLRIAIWKLSFQRDVMAIVSYVGVEFLNSEVPYLCYPPAFFVNSEARSEAKRHWEYKPFPLNFKFNKDSDKFYLFFGGESWKDGVMSEEFNDLYCLGIKHLVMHAYDLSSCMNMELDCFRNTSTPFPFFQLLVRMTELESISVVNILEFSDKGERKILGETFFPILRFHRLAYQLPPSSIIDLAYKFCATSPHREVRQYKSTVFQNMSKTFQQEHYPQWRIPALTVFEYERKIVPALKTE